MPQSGDAAASAAAYRKAAEIEPGNAENWSSLGEALQTASTSVVPEAEAAFRKALALDASDPRARYFLAVEKDLKGDHQGAVDDWLALLSDTPPGAPWEADLRRTIEQTAQRNNIDLAGRMPAPGSGRPRPPAFPARRPDQLAAASSIPPSQQDQMVQGMVERLAARLKANPKDADGWIRLMRSRMVLGQKDQARDALKNGLAAFARRCGEPGAAEERRGSIGHPLRLILVIHRRGSVLPGRITRRTDAGFRSGQF